MRRRQSADEEATVTGEDEICGVNPGYERSESPGNWSPCRFGTRPGAVLARRTIHPFQSISSKCHFHTMEWKRAEIRL